ncbi:MAG TPA: DinB family protein [Daejeonella sp.]|nr:DinB family protein [Daejeonella sp.]
MLADLIKYTQLADQRVMDIFLQAGQSMTEAEKLFSHILNAQHIWMKRIMQEPAEYGAWQLHTPQVFKEIHQDNSRLIQEVHANFAPNLEVTYRNSEGNLYTGIVADILFHVINHSTYHRAQIATLFKCYGLTPPVTDFIIMRREGLL